MRRIGFLVFVIVAFVPATASAQSPPQERAAARAFADIALRATSDMTAASLGVDEAFKTLHCGAMARVERSSAARRERVEHLLMAQRIAAFARASGPSLLKATADLRKVHTADPVLRNGRAAWGSVKRSYARFAAFRPIRLCSAIRWYVRSGFRPTAAIRRGERQYQALMRWDTTVMDQHLAAAVQRLTELGVSAADADAFDGQVDAG